MRRSGLFTSFLLASALVAAAPAAWSQEAEAPPTPAPPAAEVEVSDVARQHFRAGVAYMQDPDGARYEEAYAEFKAAYADSPSWKILGNLGIAAMKLERDGEAEWAFKQYLEEGGERIDPEERSQMQKDLSTVQAGLAWVTLGSTPPNAVFIDERQPVSGRPIVNRYDPHEEAQRVGVRRGHHKFIARLEGYEEAIWETDIEPGQELAYTFELKVPAEPEKAVAGQAGPEKAAPQRMERPVPVPVFITLGLTGALAIGGGVTGFLAMGKQKEVEDATDFDTADSARSSGQTLNLVTDILFGSAIAAGAVTAVLFFTRPEVPAEQDTALNVTPLVGPNGAAMSMSGRF